MSHSLGGRKVEVEMMRLGPPVLLVQSADSGEMVITPIEPEKLRKFNEELCKLFGTGVPVAFSPEDLKGGNRPEPLCCWTPDPIGGGNFEDCAIK
jgi:hypothetical protein